MDERVRPALLATLVFLVVLVVHFQCKIITSWDSKWYLYTAMSIIKQGNTDLDEYAKVLEEGDYRVEKVGNHLYDRYPLGTPIIAVPFILVVDKVHQWRFSSDFYEYLQQVPPGHRVRRIEHFIACFIVALTAALIYLMARGFLHDALSLLVTFVFAFCGFAWSTCSRALWTHGPSILLLTIMLCIILLAKKRPWLIQFAGVPLAFSYVTRPTNAISVLLITVFVFIQYRTYFTRFLLWAMAIAIPFFLFNLSVYRALLPAYYRPAETGATTYAVPNMVGGNPRLLEGLIGNLVSPSRGLFIFSPILLFSIYGVMVKIRNAQFDRLDGCVLGIMILHWILVSSYTWWWSGWAYGPRMLAETIPYFIYFLIPAVAAISQSTGVRKVTLVSVFCCFLTISFLIHYRGATSQDVYDWNQIPAIVDLQPSRVWDWHDIQFLRGLEWPFLGGSTHNEERPHS